MSRNTRVEEVSDSDPDDMDPSDFDFGNTIITPANIPMSVSAADAMRQRSGVATASSSSMPYGGQNPMMTSLPQPMAQQQIPRHFQCLYPVYFDRNRSRAQGRMVSSKLAVENPLAREIVDAVQALGLRCGFEPEKLHPKDWANPGRVRVMLKDESGRIVNPVVKN
ncbi:signal recognition particle subunit, partial [Ascosphaera aggregata]